MVKPDKVKKIADRTVVVVYKKDGVKNVWVWSDFERHMAAQEQDIDFVMAIEDL